MAMRGLRILQLALVAACAATAAGCLGGSADEAAPPATATPPSASSDTHLRISLDAQFLGGSTHRVYRLRCDPPSGTVADPSAVCRSLLMQPLRYFGAPDIPGGANRGGSAGVTVTGRYRGRRVRAVYDAGDRPQGLAWEALVAPRAAARVAYGPESTIEAQRLTCSPPVVPLAGPSIGDASFPVVCP
jgi:hypothetical protein